LRFKFKPVDKIPVEDKIALFNRLYTKLSQDLIAKQVGENVDISYDHALFEMLAEDVARLNGMESKTFWSKVNELFD
jgi:hypothetical protein